MDEGIVERNETSSLDDPTTRYSLSGNTPSVPNDNEPFLIIINERNNRSWFVFRDRDEQICDREPLLWMLVWIKERRGNK